MISFTTQGVAFQVRAAAVLIHDGRVLVHRAEGDDFWTLPGGRVEPDEDAMATVKRELLEELGECVTCQRLLYVVENFFDHGGSRQHEIAFYFLASLRPGSGLATRTGLFPGIELEKKLQFGWFEFAEAKTLKLYPEFLRQDLGDFGEGIRHVVERDDASVRYGSSS